MNFPSLWARSGNVFHGPPTTLTIAHFIVGNVSTVGVLPSGQLHIKTAGGDLLNAFYFPRKSLDFFCNVAPPLLVTELSIYRQGLPW